MERALYGFINGTEEQPVETVTEQVKVRTNYDLIGHIH